MATLPKVAKHESWFGEMKNGIYMFWDCIPAVQQPSKTDLVREMFGRLNEGYSKTQAQLIQAVYLVHSGLDNLKRDKSVEQTRAEAE